MGEQEPIPYICVTCGTQHPPSLEAPETCIICEDFRQYVADGGQRWTTLSQMESDGYENVFRDKENHLKCITTEPSFAIGQSAYLLKSKVGNILWDCISFLDEKTIQEIERLGGIEAIAISHPHFFASAVEWSRTFGGVPIHLHESDRKWVVRTDHNLQFWSGAKHKISEKVTLINCGGHFSGSSVLHWSFGAEGKGVILTGDTISIARDRKHISFMLSYPNYLPLSVEKAEHIAAVLEPYSFERIYDGWLSIRQEGKSVFQHSVARYIAAIQGKEVT